jgi:hypothetical protein
LNYALRVQYALCTYCKVSVIVGEFRIPVQKSRDDRVMRDMGDALVDGIDGRTVEVKEKKVNYVFLCDHKV